jgi:hypothetical protein
VIVVMTTEKTVTLQFDSFEDLWHFKKSANITSFEVSRINNVLTFKCTEEQVQIATTIFKAKLIETIEKGKEGED